MRKKLHDIASVEMGAIPVWMFIATSEEAFNRKCKELGETPAGPFILKGKTATTHFLDVPEWGMKTIIVCFNRPRRLTSDFAALVSHEAVHAAEFCWEVMGEEKPGEEVRAYTVQYLVQMFLEAMFGG